MRRAGDDYPHAFDRLSFAHERRAGALRRGATGDRFTACGPQINEHLAKLWQTQQVPTGRAWRYRRCGASGDPDGAESAKSDCEIGLADQRPTADRCWASPAKTAPWSPPQRYLSSNWVTVGQITDVDSACVNKLINIGMDPGGALRSLRARVLRTGLHASTWDTDGTSALASSAERGEAGVRDPDVAGIFG